MNSTYKLTQIKGINAAPFYPFDATLKRFLYACIFICNCANKCDMIYSNASQIIAIKTPSNQILFFFLFIKFHTKLKQIDKSVNLGKIY